MPHGITQCYLPPGRGDIPALTDGVPNRQTDRQRDTRSARETSVTTARNLNTAQIRFTTMRNDLHIISHGSLTINYILR